MRNGQAQKPVILEYLWEFNADNTATDTCGSKFDNTILLVRAKMTLAFIQLIERGH